MSLYYSSSIQSCNRLPFILIYSFEASIIFHIEDTLSCWVFCMGTFGACGISVSCKVEVSGHFSGVWEV